MIVRATIAWQMDSAFPRDAMMITPHFNNTGGLFTDTDWEGFATDLCTSMRTYSGSNKQTRVTIHDAQGTPPVYPVADVTQGSGQNPAGTNPREVAVCLSYYSGRNVGRKRGRLYVPVNVIGQSAGYIRPTTGIMNIVKSLAPLLENAGGADVDWSVFSRLDNVARAVTDYYVDDEWDTVRSRGMRPVSRVTGTASE